MSLLDLTPVKSSRVYGYIVELGNATIPCGAWGVDATRVDQAKALVLNGVFHPVQERLLTVEARGLALFIVLKACRRAGGGRYMCQGFPEVAPNVYWLGQGQSMEEYFKKLADALHKACMDVSRYWSKA